MIVDEWRARSVPQPEVAEMPVPPPGAGSAVMLIPGLLDGDHTLAFMARWLDHWGYHAIPSGIERNAGCPDLIIDQLAEHLERSLVPGERARLIGHSKGGLLSYGLAHRRPDLVSAVLGLGSPLKDPFGLQWNTTVTVRAIAVVKRFRKGRMPGCYTSRCSCAAMRLVTEQAPPVVPVTNLASRRDGIVRFESCLHPYVTVHEVSTMHNNMPWEPEALARVTEWLREPVQTTVPMPGG